MGGCGMSVVTVLTATRYVLLESGITEFPATATTITKFMLTSSVGFASESLPA